MKTLDLILKIITLLVFTGLAIAAIIGIYTVVSNFGTGTSALIAPTIFVLVMAGLGLIDTYKNKD